MKKLIAIIVLFVLFGQTQFCLADPNIISVIGTYDDETNITINGTGFGEHPSYREGTYTWVGSNPINAKFKDFQDNLIESQGFNVENNYDSEWRTSTASGRYSGDINGVRDYVASRLAMLQCTQSASVATSGMLYASFWFRPTGVGCDGKPFRWYFGDDSSDNNFYLGMSGAGPSYPVAATVETGGGGATTVYSGGSTSVAEGWQMWEITADTNTGQYRRWKNGVLVHTSNTLITGVFDPGGHSISLGSLSSNDTGTYVFDDVYYDYTQARVMICVGSDWSARGKCELQIPLTWTPTSIGVKVNFGAWSTSEIRYLYVVDSAGVASVARTIVMGSGGGGTPTPTPSSTPTPVGGATGSVQTGTGGVSAVPAPSGGVTLQIK